MKNTYSSAFANRFTKKWGTQKYSVDPYITGYHFMKWVKLPNSLITYASQIDDGKGGLPGTSTVADVLSSLCLQVTIPTGTVNRAEFYGLGNIRSAVPSNVDWDNTVTIRFLELSGLPIYKIISGWVRLIRDYRVGVSPLKNDGYGKKNYAATAYYWTTSPDGQTVEFAACLAGLFPLKDPIDSFGHDITAYDKLEIDIDFNVDYIYRDTWVYSQVKNYSTFTNHSGFDYSGDIS